MRLGGLEPFFFFFLICLELPFWWSPLHSTVWFQSKIMSLTIVEAAGFPENEIVCAYYVAKLANDPDRFQTSCWHFDPIGFILVLFRTRNNYVGEVTLLRWLGLEENSSRFVFGHLLQTRYVLQNLLRFYGLVPYWITTFMRACVPASVCQPVCLTPPPPPTHTHTHTISVCLTLSPPHLSLSLSLSLIKFSTIWLLKT